MPLEPAGSLSSYQNLKSGNGLLTQAQVSVSKDEVLAAGTVRIVPTTVTALAVPAGAQISPAQLKLVANAVDRSLCINLSDRFRIVPSTEPADLTVRAFVTRIVPTDEIAAAASTAASIATSVATRVAELSVPVPSPRIPIGLGGIALEAEALDPNGAQKAAMMWSRGANALIGRARVSAVGDAYTLAAAFGDDFSKLLVNGASPFKTLPSLPSMRSVGSLLGGPPKESACEAFGRGGGVPGLLGGAVGLPPEWTDKPPRADAQTTD